MKEPEFNSKYHEGKYMWPRTVVVCGLTMPVFKGPYELKERVVDVKWRNLDVMVPMEQLPRPPRQSILEFLFGYAPTRLRVWERERQAVSQRNQERIQRAREEVRAQLAAVCECPPEAVIVTDGHKVDYGAYWIARGSAPCLAYREKADE